MTRNSLTDDPLEAVGVAVQEADDLLSWDYPAFADEASLEFPGFDILEDCLFVAAQGRGCLGDGKEVLIGHWIPSRFSSASTRFAKSEEARLS